MINKALDVVLPLFVQLYAVVVVIKFATWFWAGEGEQLQRSW